MKLFSAFLGLMLAHNIATAEPILVPAWQSSAELKQPESVIYHPASDSLFVSNVNGQPNEIDGNGFISQLTLTGKLIKLDWLTGLNAPKGLAIADNIMYIADINELVAVDISAHKIIARYPADGAKFLNDVTIDKAGNVYVSDMMTNRIYRLKDKVLSVWLADDKLESPNGLLVDHNHLIVGSWGHMTDGFATDTPGHLKTIDIASKKIESLGDQTPAGNLDGVEADGKGNYLVTDWMNGRLLHIKPGGDSTTLLTFDQGSADLTVIPEYNLLVVPLMLNNKLVAFRVN